jgi:hypothetical protein
MSCGHLAPGHTRAAKFTKIPTKNGLRGHVRTLAVGLPFRPLCLPTG